MKYKKIVMLNSFQHPIWQAAMQLTITPNKVRGVMLSSSKPERKGHTRHTITARHNKSFVLNKSTT